MSETATAERVSKDPFRKLQTGKGIAKPTVAYLPNREAANEQKKEAPVTTAEVKTETAPETKSEVHTETLSTGLKPEDKQELPNRVVVTPDTILVDEKGNSISVKEAQFFGYKKENWDRAATAIKQTRKELDEEKARLEKEANSPLLRTARAIREANPEYTEEQVQIATVRALGLTPTHTEAKKEEAKPRPTPPPGAMQGDKEWAEYEAADRAWLLDEMDRRNDAKIQPLLDTIKRSNQQSETEKAEDKRAKELFNRNKAIVQSRWDYLPFDRSKLSEEQVAAIDEAILEKAAQKGMYLDNKSLASAEIDEDKFGLICESIYPVGSLPPGANPSEILTTKLTNGEPLVEKAQPKQPPAPGLQDKTLNPKPNQQGRPRKDDWYSKLNGQE